MDDFLNVTTAVDTQHEAFTILRSAVKKKLAASGQISTAVVTAAWWHNEKYCEGNEWVLLLKTTAGRRAELEKHLADVHPRGATAEVTIVPIDGSENYLNWIRRATDHQSRRRLP
jgi:uncharacterized protein involved in tolerance to divalent cations